MSFGNLFSSSSENQSVRQDRLPAGTHLLAVVAITIKQSRGNHGRRAEFRFTLLSSTNKDAAVGSEYGEVFFPESAQVDSLEATRGRLRALTRAIAGLPVNAEPEEVSKAWEAMSGDSQAAKGVKIRCTGTQLESNRGKKYIACIYESVPQSDEDIAETIKLIDGASIPQKAAAQMDAPVPAGIAARLAAVGK